MPQRYLLGVILLGPGALAAQDVYRAELVPVHNCVIADSALGAIADGVHPHLLGVLEPAGIARLSTRASGESQSLGSHTVTFTVSALAGPHPGTPSGFLSLMVGGEAGRAILRSQQAPALRLELPDSIVLTPKPVILGTYNGPDAFAVAPVTAPLTGPSVAALARARWVIAVAGEVRVPVPLPVLESLHDAYRTALCGYQRSPQ